MKDVNVLGFRPQPTSSPDRSDWCVRKNEPKAAMAYCEISNCYCVLLVFTFPSLEGLFRAGCLSDQLPMIPFDVSTFDGKEYAVTPLPILTLTELMWNS